MALHGPLHRIYIYIYIAEPLSPPQGMVDLLESGMLYPPFDLGADARAVFHAVSGIDTCEPADHLVWGQDMLFQTIVRELFWVDARDMLADRLTNGGIDMYRLHQISNICRYVVRRETLVHSKSHA